MSDAVTIYIYRQTNGWESDVWRELLFISTVKQMAGSLMYGVEMII